MIGSRPKLGRLAVLPLLFLLACFAWGSLGNAVRNQRNDRLHPGGSTSRQSRDLFRFIRENTRESDTILFFKPRVMRFMTRRRSLMINRDEDVRCGDYLALHRDAPAKDTVSFDHAAALERRGEARLIFENDACRLYALSSGSEVPRRR